MVSKCDIINIVGIRFPQAFKKFNEGKVMELVDPSMKEVVEAELLVKVFDLAMQCAAPVGADRPDMNSVTVQLQKIREDYLCQRG